MRLSRNIFFMCLIFKLSTAFIPQAVISGNSSDLERAVEESPKTKFVRDKPGFVCVCVFGVIRFSFC